MNHSQIPHPHDADGKPRQTPRQTFQTSREGAERMHEDASQPPDADATAGPEWRGLSQDLTTALSKRNLENADLQAEVTRLRQDSERLEADLVAVEETKQNLRASLATAERERDALREALQPCVAAIEQLYWLSNNTDNTLSLALSQVPASEGLEKARDAREVQARAALAPKEATK